MERKLASVLFVDLVDSTALVAGADPEVVRQRVNRYFEQVARCIETHGGTVEKFAGDAVMAAFVGREVELELLHNTYARAVRDRRAHLVTVFGEPGIGKSRLVHEFVEGVERATVLRGRCLPFGEGVTYWALAEMVKQSAGIADDDPVAEAFEKLRACCESDAIADLLASASGLLLASERKQTREEL